MKNDRFITARVHYLIDNERNLSKPLTVGLRCSLWIDETNFTASEWRRMDQPLLLPGETCIIKMLTINSKIWVDVSVGDKMFWGVPYDKVGELEILSLDDEPVPLVVD